MFTVLVCCSSVGHFLPPRVVYKGKSVRFNWSQGGDETTTYGTTPSGWMESEEFVRWFKKTFVAHTKTLTGKKILFLDGHHSHISTKLFDLADENNIFLAKLIPHTSHILQPLDISVFRHVKTVWRDALNKHFKLNGFRDVTKSMFPALMKIVIDSGFKSENAVSGFKAAGIYPLNPEAVKSKLNQGKAFRAHTPASKSAPATPATPATPAPNKRIVINTPTSYNSRIKKNQLTNLSKLT